LFIRCAFRIRIGHIEIDISFIVVIFRSCADFCDPMAVTSLLCPCKVTAHAQLEVRAVAARGIYESLTIHRLAVPVTQKGVSHNQSATEMVTSFGKAGTGYCAVIAGQTTVTTARLRQCDRGIITGYSISGH